MDIKAVFSKVVADVNAARHNLPAIRKEIVSALTSAASVVALAQTLAPQVSGEHQAIFATIAGAVSGALTFLTRSDVVDEVNKLTQ